jgi:putative endonuclease
MWQRLPAVGLAKEGLFVHRVSVHYVYLLQSEALPGRHYVGFTHNLKVRFASHNAGQNTSTVSGRPWLLASYFAFADEKKAIAFEKYLKSGSGRTFLKRPLVTGVHSKSRRSTPKMGRPTGLEPATPRFTILCSNQLSYDRRVGSGKILGSLAAVNRFFRARAGQRSPRQAQRLAKIQRRPRPRAARSPRRIGYC